MQLLCLSVSDHTARSKKLDGKEFDTLVVSQQMSLRDTSKFKTIARLYNEIKTGSLYDFL